MGKTHWWDDAGSFQPWNMCPSRPDPLEVLLFYMEKRGIGSDERMTCLMNLLNVQKSTIYQIFQGYGFNSISRCRLLVREFTIPPALLGIDAKYWPIEEHPHWWQDAGFSFEADSQGYPVISEVITCLRAQYAKAEGTGKIKIWTQEDLADACGLKRETVYRMERNRNPFILDNMSRLALVASALGALAGDQEPTIFRLFGLEAQAYRVQVPTSDMVSIIDLPYSIPSDDVLQQYQQKLAAFFTEYSTSHAQNTVPFALEWVKQLSVLLSRAGTSAQRLSVLALQSRTHRLLACVAREQCETERILFHTAQAIERASQAMTLLDSELSNDCVWQVKANELLVSALFTEAMASYELGHSLLARRSIERALELLPRVRSRYLKAEILAVDALIRAWTITGAIDQHKVLSSMGCAIQTHQLARTQRDTPDENFFQLSSSMLLIHRARALSSPKMRGMTGESVLDLLEKAQRLTDPQFIRQQVMIEYLQALSHFLAGSYEQAVSAALSALEKCRRIRSRLWKNCIEELYQRLLDTSFRCQPLLVYLGIKLRMWDYQIEGSTKGDL